MQGFELYSTQKVDAQPLLDGSGTESGPDSINKMRVNSLEAVQSVDSPQSKYGYHGKCF